MRDIRKKALINDKNNIIIGNKIAFKTRNFVNFINEMEIQTIAMMIMK
jgi:hypothetical protein